LGHGIWDKGHECAKEMAFFVSLVPFPRAFKYELISAYIYFKREDIVFVGMAWRFMSIIPKKLAN
jgi:hypothetical protein